MIMRIFTLFILLFEIFHPIVAQELYIYSEPASNMPARAFGLKYSGKFLENKNTLKNEQRHGLELQFGHNKKWMTHVASTISDMYSPNVRWESFRIYSKYRLLSVDDVHKHFRAAAFGEFSSSINPVRFDELNLEGDQSGLRGGVILTQLVHKLAVSTTLSYIYSLQDRIKGIGHSHNYNAFNYSLSGGYLLYPRSYKSYNQTNFNIYLECLGSQAVDTKTAFLDLAPALQLIFTSNTKLNVGYRFQVAGNMNRMANNSFHISIERTFLNALRPPK